MTNHVIILFGGETRESLVSTATAQNLAEHTENPTIWFWAKNNQVFEISKQDLLSHEKPFELKFETKNDSLFSSLKKALDSLTKTKNQNSKDGDIFLLALHGGRGENGTVQKWLEQRNIRYIGSNSKSSELCFDKKESKAKIRNSHIKDLKAPKDLFMKQMWHQKYYKPFIVKPNADGSSFGLHFIRSQEDLVEFKSKNKLDFKDLIAEDLIRGQEFTVPVVSNKALAVIEIKKDAKRDFDYAAKYFADGVSEICPAEIDEGLAKKLQEKSLACHKALGCSGYSRTDFIVQEEGEETTIYFLETNTLPGLTKESLLPKALAHAGVEMHDFIKDQIKLLG